MVVAVVAVVAVVVVAVVVVAVEVVAVVVVAVDPEEDGGEGDDVGLDGDAMTNPHPREGSSSVSAVETTFDELAAGPLADGAVVDVTTVREVTPPDVVVVGDVEVVGDVVVGASTMTRDEPWPGGRDTATPVATRATADSARAVRNGHRRGPRGGEEGVIESTVTVGPRPAPSVGTDVPSRSQGADHLDAIIATRHRGACSTTARRASNPPRAPTQLAGRSSVAIHSSLVVTTA